METRRWRFRARSGFQPGDAGPDAGQVAVAAARAGGLVGGARGRSGGYSTQAAARMAISLVEVLRAWGRAIPAADSVSEPAPDQYQEISIQSQLG